jgi:hypothetical protein
MEKETLEEAAHKMLDDYGIKSMGQTIGVLKVKELMVNFAKWQQQQDKNKYSEEDLKEAYFSAISSTGEGWNGEYAQGNDPNIEEKFTEGFNEWFEQFKNK